MKTTIQHLASSLFIVIICLPVCGQGTFDFGISTMNKSSGTISSLIDLPGTGEFNPAWSPDGRTIAFDIVSPTDPHRVGLASSSGTLLTIFSGSSDDANNPSWSADGRTLAVDKVPVGDFSIYGINVSTGVTSLLVSDAICPDFSNKRGRRQLLVYNRPSDGNIYTLDISTGIERLITAGENAQWSKNDKTLVYSLAGDVYTIAVNANGGAAGSPILRVGDPLFIESRPTWLSSNEIAFHADYSGDFDIYKVKIYGSSRVRLIGGNLGSNDFDPDSKGGLIAFAEGTFPSPLRNISIHPRSVNQSMVYPNPANNILNLEFDLEIDDFPLIAIYDMMGREVYKKTFISHYGKVSLQIDLPNQISAGNYIIRINGKNLNDSHRITVK